MGLSKYGFLITRHVGAMETAKAQILLGVKFLLCEDSLWLMRQANKKLSC